MLFINPQSLIFQSYLLKLTMSLKELIDILPPDTLIKSVAENGSIDLLEQILQHLTYENKFIKPDYQTALSRYFQSILLNVDKLKLCFKFLDRRKLSLLALDALPYKYFNDGKIEEYKRYTPSLRLINDIINESKMILSSNHISIIADFAFMTDNDLYNHISRMLINSDRSKINAYSFYSQLIKLRFIKCIKLLLVWKFYPINPHHLVKLFVEMQLFNLCISFIKNRTDGHVDDRTVEYVADLPDSRYLDYILDHYKINNKKLYIKLLLQEDPRIHVVTCSEGHIIEDITKELLVVDRKTAHRIFRSFVADSGEDEYDFMVVRCALQLGVDDIALEFAKKSINSNYYEFITAGRLDLFAAAVKFNNDPNGDYNENYWYSSLANEYGTDRRKIGTDVWKVIFEIYPPEEVKADWRVIQSALCSQTLYETLIERRYRVSASVVNKYTHFDKPLQLIGLCDGHIDVMKFIRPYPRPTVSDMEELLIRFCLWYPDHDPDYYGLIVDHVIDRVKFIRSSFEIFFSSAVAKIICTYY